MASLSIQILAGLPPCIHDEGYAYPKPAVQLAEGINAYSVSPSIATYTQGNAIKYSSLEESAYTSVTPVPIIKQAVYSAPVAVTKSYLPPPPVITKSYLPPIGPVSYTAPVAKIATYTPTTNIVSIPAVKSVEYQYPKISTGYQAASVA